jgi:hypothetical protein
MANSLGNASLILATNGSQLQQGLDQAQGQVQGFASKANSVFATIGSAATFGGIAAGIGAAIGLVTSGFARLTEVGRQTREATALGINVEQYQGLSQILQRAGIQADQTGDFFGSFNAKLERAARTGAGPVAAALGNMGVDLQSLMAMPADERFLALADAFQRVGPSAQASAAAMNIFGSTAILPSLQRGRESLQGFIDEAKRNGEILSGTEAETAAKAAKAWTDASRTLKRAWDSVSLQVASALAPLVSQAAEIFQKIVPYVTPVIKGISEAFSTVVEIVEPVFQTIAGAVQEAVGWVRSFFAEMGVQFPSIRTIILETFRAISTVGAWTWDLLKAGAGGFAVSVGFVIEGIGKLLNAYADMIGIARVAAEDIGRGMRQWGTQAVLSFGQSSTAVNQFFDNLRNRQRQAQAEAARPLAPAQRLGPDMTPAGFSPVKPLLQGSADFYRFQAQWKADPESIGQDPKEMQREMLRETRRQGGVLDRIEANTGRDRDELEPV